MWKRDEGGGERRSEMNLSEKAEYCGSMGLRKGGENVYHIMQKAGFSHKQMSYKSIFK